jgi:hypothetical protein
MEKLRKKNSQMKKLKRKNTSVAEEGENDLGVLALITLYENTRLQN